MNTLKLHKLGIDIGSTTVKIAILDEQNTLVFSDYERHFANIRETLTDLLHKAYEKLGQIQLCPMITGSGGLTLAKHLGVPFVQEVIAVSTALQDAAPQTDVAIELGGEDAKIIYFEGGNVEQRMPLQQRKETAPVFLSTATRANERKELEKLLLNIII